ncbi:hypothetical protein CU097_010213 [Rhizopus azygosporus]|uniref:Uncharacterized protein n=1 Tax=Rhizopus azygosporus TaxID=86630 RepID=A0A367JLG2_RHIAZ|nr:hypothetical protein CU097_010213 [Rhizopus azygosporus]
MSKTIADTYYYGSIQKFGQVKVFFAHATDKVIYLWSVRYEDKGRLYELWLERRPNLQTQFEKRRVDFLNQEHITNDFILYKGLLEEATDKIIGLQQEHHSKLVQHLFSTPPTERLDAVVNPSTLKLTEENDKARMHLSSPFFTSK